MQASSPHQQLNHAQTSLQEAHFSLCVLAHNLQIAGNVGSLFRLADAFGVEKLYLSGSTQTPPRYKIRKAARSADKHIPYEYQASALNLVQQLKADGYCIVALEITNSSLDIRNFSLPKGQKTCLLIGAENHGIAPELLAQTDYAVHIAMFGKNSSMNVVNACAIALHELVQHL